MPKQAPRSYQPMMSAKRAKQIRAWHEDAIKGQRKDTIEMSYLGLTLLIPPEVHAPAPVSPLLGEAVQAEVRETDRVLDVGTGSGVNAILAASKSADIVAVDINPAAVTAAKRNAARNGVGPRINVLKSDIFKKVEGKFDLVIFDPPFRWFKPRNMRERSTADEGYGSLTHFFEHVRDYLKPNGRILMFFGSSGDINYLRHLIRKAGFKRKILASLGTEKDGLKVKYYTYRLTIHHRGSRSDLGS